MARRVLNAPVAGPHYNPLPAAPLRAKAVTNLSVSASEPTIHACGDDTIMVRLLIKGGAIQIAEGETATSASQELNPLGGPGMYDTRGVEPGAMLSLLAIDGLVAVQIVEF